MRGRPALAARIVPFPGDQATAPGEQRRRGHGEHLAPPVAGDQPGQRREPQPVSRLIADPAGLPAQHCILVPQDQQLRFLGSLAPGQQHQAAEQAAREQVGD